MEKWRMLHHPWKFTVVRWPCSSAILLCFRLCTLVMLKRWTGSFWQASEFRSVRRSVSLKTVLFTRLPLLFYMDTSHPSEYIMWCILFSQHFSTTWATIACAIDFCQQNAVKVSCMSFTASMVFITVLDDTHHLPYCGNNFKSTLCIVDHRFINYNSFQYFSTGWCNHEAHTLSW